MCENILILIIAVLDRGVEVLQCVKSVLSYSNTKINNSIYLKGSERTEGLSNVEETSYYGSQTNVWDDFPSLDRHCCQQYCFSSVICRRNAVLNWSNPQHQQGSARWYFPLPFPLHASTTVAELFWDSFFFPHTFLQQQKPMKIPVLYCVHLHPLPSPPHLIHGTAAVLFWNAAVLLIFYSQHQLSCLGLAGFCKYCSAVAQPVDGASGDWGLSGTALLYKCAVQCS